ncbi:hypothetical protein SAMN06272735_7531 [Streptomyces sp. TLI_55]|uniref:hypothetical protein n=1 Tax=Streptomyces sp. TLI_55 TaxID=1938861 RepID=UPI000BDAD220|nr:hypothetical protein [Streptomyces sp. TLI_55]SNX65692.1 hypothetical protein SAMN06272735_7531 [Streptomyces sp. TLI_55]
MGTPVRTSAEEPPLLTEFGLVESALEMEFTAYFPREGGTAASDAAAAAVIGVIEAPTAFVVALLDAAHRVSGCLLARTTAETCRLVLTADRTGITVAGTDDTTITLDRADEDGTRDLPVSAVVDGLHVHHGPEGHVWVVWHGAWRTGPDDSAAPDRVP